MRATVDAKEFSQALDKASKVLTKSRVPVLGEVMDRFSDGRCVLTGTDLNTWMIAELPARGDEFAFVFHQTANVAKACRRFEGELSFELTETGEGREKHLKLCMSCGYRAGEFNAFFPEDYPNLPELKPKYSACCLIAAGRFPSRSRKGAAMPKVRNPGIPCPLCGRELNSCDDRASRALGYLSYQVCAFAILSAIAFGKMCDNSRKKSYLSGII